MHRDETLCTIRHKVRSGAMNHEVRYTLVRDKYTMRWFTVHGALCTVRDAQYTIQDA